MGYFRPREVYFRHKKSNRKTSKKKDVVHSLSDEDITVSTKTRPALIMLSREAGISGRIHFSRSTKRVHAEMIMAICPLVIIIPSPCL